MMTLTAYGRAVSTPFGLLGNDENALSFALGYTLRECPLLLRQFLSAIGVSGVRLNSLAAARIELQRHGAESGRKGITDIEIRLPGRFHVIIEAKVGLDLPSIEQCVQYAPRLEDSNEPVKRLVALVQVPNISFDGRYKKSSTALRDILVAYNWCEFLLSCVQLMKTCGQDESEGRAIRWFYNFLDQEYRMKAFTTEVWIVPTSSEPLWPGGWSFLDTHLKCHVYYDHRHQTVRPLYIGFQGNGQLTAIHRVLRIEHETPPIKYVPQLSHVKDEWPRSLLTIWHLDGPVALPTLMPSGGNNVHRRKVSCDLDVLLTGKSVLDIESRMRERRESATS
jgi:hypothetical protein